MQRILSGGDVGSVDRLDSISGSTERQQTLYDCPIGARLKRRPGLGNRGGLWSTVSAHGSGEY